MNKRGDVISIFYIVMIIFVIGIIFFFSSHVSDKILTEMRSTLANNGMNTSETNKVLDTSINSNHRVWDYAFLGVYMGILVALAMTSFATRISPFFFWIYVIISIIVLFTGVYLSNLWQDMSANAEFASTIDNFPIMNMLLGSYAPIAITAIILVSLIFLFAKPPEENI